MINQKLFNLLTKLPHITGRIQKTPGRPVPCYGYLLEGFAYEFYQTDKNEQLVSWFWLDEEFVIPTSPHSTIVFSKEADFIDFDYSAMFSSLRGNEENREDYYYARARHNLEIEERINDLQYLSPFKNYLKLKQTKPAVFDYAGEEQIASFLNIGVSGLRRFMLKRQRFMKAW